MLTRLLSEKDAALAGELLRKGGLVAIPTETVYGLAANALCGDAVAAVFKAKGRPCDNPLIVHIASLSELYPLVESVPDAALALAEKFWPGPLTMILKKSALIPNEVSGGLPTVAVRMPSHPAAAAVIRAAGLPLAAPSANISGRPSPTTAQHVLDDLGGKIDAVLDGGPCSVGVESTVISLCTEPPRLLRPGGITKEEIESVIGGIELDRSVLGLPDEGEKPASPGMKYKHYSPKAQVFLVEADSEKFAAFINSLPSDEAAGVLAFDEELPRLRRAAVLSFGSAEDSAAHAQKLFSALRSCDESGFIRLYVHKPKASGVDLAVVNRLLRAAEFKELKL